jgi:hypothetical protein
LSTLYRDSFVRNCTQSRRYGQRQAKTCLLNSSPSSGPSCLQIPFPKRR